MMLSLDLFFLRFPLSIREFSASVARTSRRSAGARWGTAASSAQSRASTHSALLIRCSENRFRISRVSDRYTSIGPKYSGLSQRRPYFYAHFRWCKNALPRQLTSTNQGFHKRSTLLSEAASFANPVTSWMLAIDAVHRAGEPVS